MHKVYAVDLIAMEEKLEELEAERDRIKSLSLIMRRVKQARSKELDSQIHDLQWKIVSAKEHVLADPTSVKIYEAKTEKKRQKELEASAEAENEPEP